MEENQVIKILAHDQEAGLGNEMQKSLNKSDAPFLSFLFRGKRRIGDANVNFDWAHAVMQDIKISDYAEEHEELKTALTKWGTGRTGFQM